MLYQSLEFLRLDNLEKLLFGIFRETGLKQLVYEVQLKALFRYYVSANACVLFCRNSGMQRR